MNIAKSFDKINLDNDVIIYGKHAVISALENKSRKIKKMYLAEKQKDFVNKILKLLKSKNYFIKIEKIERKNLDLFFGKNTKHQGIVVIANKIINPTYKKIFDEKNFSHGVILDRLTDPHNVGAIYRSAYNFDLDFVINTEKGSPKESGALLNSSCGCYDKINTYITKNLVDCIKEFKKNDWWVIGGDLNTKIDLNNFFSLHQDLKKFLIILGSEGSGMKRLTRKHCDFLIKINTNNEKNSLNVSNAAAIFFYEIYKHYSGTK